MFGSYFVKFIFLMPGYVHCFGYLFNCGQFFQVIWS